MNTVTSNREQSARADNLSRMERWGSMLAGAGLIASAMRGRGIVGRLARGSAGLSLITRGATGYCAVKAASQGQTSMREGLQEQWRRVTNEVGGAVQGLRARSAPQINSMEAMYASELQELHSAEKQLIHLTRDLASLIDNSQLAFRIEGYANELEAREDELDELLDGVGAEHRGHPDDAMRALIAETQKMAHIPANNVRDSAIAASIQRIIHYKIAGYGAIASYAKALGRTDEAAQFAKMSDRDKAIDAEISDIAKRILNPEAVTAPQATTAGGETRATH